MRMSLLRAGIFLFVLLVAAGMGPGRAELRGRVLPDQLRQ